jgi:hypothetical protein
MIMGIRMARFPGSRRTKILLSIIGAEKGK